MKRIVLAVFGLFTLISFFEIYYSLPDFLVSVYNFSISLKSITTTTKLLHSLYSFFSNVFITYFLHFIVFLVGFIKVLKNVIKTHNVHGDLLISEKEEKDHNHIFPQLLAFLSIVSGVVLLTLRISSAAPTGLSLFNTILVQFLYTFLPALLLILFARRKNGGKWLFIVALLLFVLYKLSSLLTYTLIHLEKYHKLSISPNPSSWFLVVGYSLIIFAVFKGLDCHKTFKLMLNCLVIITIIPYRNIIFSYSFLTLITNIYSLIISLCMPLCLDLLIHKALPEKTERT